MCRNYLEVMIGFCYCKDMDSQDDGINAFVKQIRYADLTSNVVVRDVAFDSDRSIENVVQVSFLIDFRWGL